MELSAGTKEKDDSCFYHCVLGLLVKTGRQDATVNSTDYSKPIYF